MKRLKQILSQVLQIKEEQITDETSPSNTETWDSFAGLMLVSELENRFNIKFAIDEVVAVKKVKDIKYFLEKHGVMLKDE